VEGWYNRIWKETAKPLCTWLVSPNAATILQKDKKGWTVWTKNTPINGRMRSQRAQYTNTMGYTATVVDCRLCSVDKTSAEKLQLRDIGPVRQGEANPNNQWKKYGWIVPSLQTNKTAEKKMVQNIRDQQGKIVTDGSFNHGRMTAAFMSIAKHPIKGSNMIPGHKQDHSSYRGELGSILLAITVTNEMCKKYNITKGKCTLGVDSKGALATTFRWKRPNTR